MNYEWLKVVHLLAVISWMAGLFYLPRLFVYHSSVAPGSDSDATFKVMERRLIGAIMRPAAVATLISGGLLAHTISVGFGQTWFLAKIAGVACLFAFHGLLEHYVSAFAVGRRARSARFFRIVNEIPTVLLVWIVIWVVVKPLS